MLIAHLTALFTVIIWGLTFISTKILLGGLSAEAILFYRFLLGWLALWAFSRAWLPWQGTGAESTFAAAGFFGVTLYFLLENIALEYTFASNASVIVSSTPFFTALVDWLFFGAAKPRPRFYAGFCLAMTGITLISFREDEIQISPLGDLLALLAAIAWAFYSVLTKKLTALGLGSLVTTRRIFFYGLVFILPLLPLRGAGSVATLLRPAMYGNMLFLGLGASALCFATWTYCLIRLGTARSSAYIYLVPVVTAIAAAFWLQERLTLAILAGMGLVIAGLVLSEYGHIHKKTVTVAPN